MSSRAALIIPTHNHATTLPYTLRSALAQTVQDIEVHIVGDGVGDDTRAVVEQFMRDDPRVRFHDHPKGPRRGEAYRHRLVQSIDAPIIGYLSDDDLIFPEHLEVMEHLLRDADIATPPQLVVVADGTLRHWPIDVGDPWYRSRLIAGGPLRVYHRLSLTGTTHTKAAYDRLPYGWRTTPEGLPTDVYMWLQFLDQPWCRAVTGTEFTRLILPSSVRGDVSLPDRGSEIAVWAEKVSDPSRRHDVDREILRAVTWCLKETDYALRQLEDKRWWRARLRVGRVLRPARNWWRARRGGASR